jgi:hypothetical protein
LFWGDSGSGSSSGGGGSSDMTFVEFAIASAHSKDSLKSIPGPSHLSFFQFQLNGMKGIQPPSSWIFLDTDGGTIPPPVMFEMIVLFDVCGQTQDLCRLKITHFHRDRINLYRPNECRSMMIRRKRMACCRRRCHLLELAGIFGQAGMACAIDGEE